MTDVVEDRTVEPGAAYGDGEQVRVRIRKRGHRYVVDDDGRAWQKAGASGRAALEVAEQVVLEDSLNVNRRGVVFVPFGEGRDVDELSARVASCSVGVYDALLELDD